MIIKQSCVHCLCVSDIYSCNVNSLYKKIWIINILVENKYVFLIISGRGSRREAGLFVYSCLCVGDFHEKGHITVKTQFIFWNIISLRKQLQFWYLQLSNIAYKYFYQINPSPAIGNIFFFILWPFEVKIVFTVIR